jgi:hypothetical protein
MQWQFWFNVWNSDPGKTVILFVDNKLKHLKNTSRTRKHVQIEKIFRLPGRYVDSSTEGIIYLDCQNKNRNKHEQEFIRMMERACVKLARSNIKLNDGRLLRMKYVT